MMEGETICVGVTGTRHGMNKYQMQVVRNTMAGIDESYGDVTLLHGGCVGVDIQVATAAKRLGWYVICHPGPDGESKDGCVIQRVSDEILPVKNFFARNRDIVDNCDHLIVVPPTVTNPGRGGTWYTHDYAVKRKRGMTIALPE